METRNTKSPEKQNESAIETVNDTYDEIENRGIQHLSTFMRKGILVKYLEYQMSLQEYRHIGEIFDSGVTDDRLFFYAGDEALKNILFNKDMCVLFEGYMYQFTQLINKSNVELVKNDVANYFLTPIFTSEEWKNFMKQQKNIIKMFHANDEDINNIYLEKVELRIKGQFLYALMMHWSSRQKNELLAAQNAGKVVSFAMISKNFHLPTEEIISYNNALVKDKAKKNMTSSSTYISKLSLNHGMGSFSEITSNIDYIYRNMLKIIQDLQSSTQRDEIFLTLLSDFIEYHFNKKEAEKNPQKEHFMVLLARKIVLVVDTFYEILNKSDENNLEKFNKSKSIVNNFIEKSEVNPELSRSQSNSSGKLLSLFLKPPQPLKNAPKSISSITSTTISIQTMSVSDTKSNVTSIRNSNK